MRGGVRLSLIAAVAENGVIGRGSAIPWRLSSDLRRFKLITVGKPVVMGRRTFESIGKPLAGRTNIVISGAGFASEGVRVVADLDTGLAVAFQQAGADDVGEVFVIGGEQVYRGALSQADRLYITHVAAAPEGDAHFPPIDPAVWRVVSTEAVPAGEKDSAASTFVVYEQAGAAGSG